MVALLELENLTTVGLGCDYVGDKDKNAAFRNGGGEKGPRIERILETKRIFVLMSTINHYIITNYRV